MEVKRNFHQKLHQVRWNAILFWKRQKSLSHLEWGGRHLVTWG